MLTSDIIRQYAHRWRSKSRNARMQPKKYTNSHPLELKVQVWVSPPTAFAKPSCRRRAIPDFSHYQDGICLLGELANRSAKGTALKEGRQRAPMWMLVYVL